MQNKNYLNNNNNNKKFNTIKLIYKHSHEQTIYIKHNLDMKEGWNVVHGNKDGKVTVLRVKR